MRFSAPSIALISVFLVNTANSLPQAVDGTLSQNTTALNANVKAIIPSDSTQNTSKQLDSTSATPVKGYIVWPNDGTKTDEVNAIADKLKSYDQNVAASTTETLGLNYWRLTNINLDQANEIAKITNVRAVNDDCSDACSYDPSIELVYQTGVKDQLNFMSWPDSTAGRPDRDRYYFDDSQGTGVDVYVIDTGANLDNPEFKRFKSKRSEIEWIQVGSGSEAGEDDPPLFTRAHGTSMLSIIAGDTLGVAKEIVPHIVRLPHHGPVTAYNYHEWIDALGKVNDKIRPNQDDSVTAVVLMATFFGVQAFRLGNELDNPFGFEYRCAMLLKQMALKGAVLVTGTGNAGDRTVNGWPANLGKKSTPDALKVPSMLVMGAINPDGSESLYGSTDIDQGLPDAYAPGNRVTVAEGNKEFWREGDDNSYYKTADGTSDAAAHTAGLAAYFVALARRNQLKDGDTVIANNPQSIKDFIVKKSWSRAQFDGIDRPGIFNNVHLALAACPWSPDASIQRRGDECPIPQPTTTFSPPIPATPTQVITQLGTSDVTCHKASDFPGHADIHPNVVEDYAGFWCDDHKVDLHKGDDAVDEVRTTFDGINYEYSISWRDGCETTVDHQSTESPLGDDAIGCQALFTKTYTSCDNTGVGGYIDVGCLRYTFTGGKGDS